MANCQQPLSKPTPLLFALIEVMSLTNNLKRGFSTWELFMESVNNKWISSAIE